MRFTNRENASFKLLKTLHEFRGRDPLVLAISPGAVFMGKILADSLDGELDLMLIAETPLGLVVEDGEVVVSGRDQPNELDEQMIEDSAMIEIRRLQARRQKLSPLTYPPDPRGRQVIIVADAIANGGPLAALAAAIRQKDPASIAIASPVISREAVGRLEREQIAVYRLHTPDTFGSARDYYDEFDAISDDDVVRVMNEARRAASRPGTGAARRAHADLAHENRPQAVTITAGEARIEGVLTIPEHAKGVVIFVTGHIEQGAEASAIGFVAKVLNESGIATCVMNLLSGPEEYENRHTFATDLLAERVAACCDWLARQPDTRQLPVGLFAFSVGAGGALQAAAGMGRRIQSVVCCGGRSDLAADLDMITAPTLLIVAEQDLPVLHLNQQSFRHLHCQKQLEIIPGASHGMTEPGAMEQVARIASRWFSSHLGSHPIFVPPPGEGDSVNLEGPRL